jgi:hypothetical protein
MVDWEAARARAPHSTSLAGLSGTRVTGAAVPVGAGDTGAGTRVEVVTVTPGWIATRGDGNERLSYAMSDASMTEGPPTAPGWLQGVQVVMSDSDATSQSGVLPGEARTPTPTITPTPVRPTCRPTQDRLPDGHAGGGKVLLAWLAKPWAWDPGQGVWEGDAEGHDAPPVATFRLC